MCRKITFHCILAFIMVAMMIGEDASAKGLEIPRKRQWRVIGDWIMPVRSPYIEDYFSLYVLSVFLRRGSSVTKKDSENNFPNDHVQGTSEPATDLVSSTIIASTDDDLPFEPHDHTSSSTLDIGETPQRSEGSEREETSDYSNYHDCDKIRTRVKRIVGGRDSTFGSHPWQVALFKPTLKGKPYCGGALLNKRWIVTAAHCLYDKKIEALTVRLGEFNIKKTEEDQRYKEYTIKKVETHPEFVYKKHRYDLALAKLDRTVHFALNILPVCLPHRSLSLAGRKATVSGWGRRNHDEKESAPAILNEVQVKVFPNEVCQKWFLEAGHNRTIDDVFLCAGDNHGGKDSCKGDSGGPLTTLVDERNVLVGVVSWGFGCGREHSPGVYTSIQKFTPWILKILS